MTKPAIPALPTVPRTPAARLLRRAASNWRLGSLWPYLWLAAATAITGVVLTGQLQWPHWVLVAMLAAVALASLADRQWHLPTDAICRKLDSRFPQLQDSCQLLRRAPEQLHPIAQIQRARTAAELGKLLDAGALKRFRPHWHRSPVLNAIGACLGLLFFFAVDRLPREDSAADIATAQIADQSTAIALREAATQVRPPAYTGLPPQTQLLQVAAPEQSQVTWQVELNMPVEGLAMLAAQENFSFAASGPLPSRHWKLTRKVETTDFYQLSARRDGDALLLPEMHNIEVTADRAPEFSFDYPQDNVTVIGSASGDSTSRLNVSVTVADDFGVEETNLLITLASGNGENVRFRNDRIRLDPTGGDARTRKYRFSVPVARYTIEPGDELYWYLESRDNRQPEANFEKSQHFIVRWQQEEIFGLSDAEGMAIKVLPEYFRSQRQLIIDTEALLAGREQISATEFRKRAESLAYEQDLLRMRYGRFLGEEDSELEHGGDHHSEAGAEYQGSEHAEREGHEEHYEDGEHGGPPQQFGDASGVIASAGHQHDNSEHATLFDPETKELLRSALNAMWSSWRELSVIEPRASLPHQHTALRYIKEVQQASRIYLQRVGFEPPALDETRRLTGEMDDLQPPPVSAERSAEEREQILRLLARVRGDNGLDEKTESELRDLPRVRQQPELAVELAKAQRLYRQRPNCADCREQLATLLYQLLPAPQAQPSLPRERAPRGDFHNWLQRQSGNQSRPEVSP